jgi:putative molybdopterin biosynthesis protein
MIPNIKFGIMAITSSVRTAPLFDNRLRERRLSLGLTQKQLADMAGITRQAVAAVETNQYSPATTVALQLARALHCRVEDLFSLKNHEQVVEAELIGSLPTGSGKIRTQLTQVGNRLLARPLVGAGELASLGTTADGLIVAAEIKGKRVKVELLREPAANQRKLVVAGCDPAMFLAAEHARRHDGAEIVPFLMGSGMALDALKRGEVHVAGVHFADENSAEILASVKRQLGKMDCVVVTFAHWEEGFLVRSGNPKNIHSASDLAKPTVTIVNRERGSGARRLLDRELEAAGISSRRVKGYGVEVFSHLDVAWRVEAGLADAGIGVRAAAAIRGLDFVPLQRERYDLIISKTHYESLPGFKILFDTVVGAAFRSELEALGGYDTREIGRVVLPAN